MQPFRSTVSNDAFTGRLVEFQKKMIPHRARVLGKKDLFFFFRGQSKVLVGPSPITSNRYWISSMIPHLTE